MVTILVVILVLALIGALPTWPYSRGWGYYPSGGVGLIVLILLILLLLDASETLRLNQRSEVRARPHPDIGCGKASHPWPTHKS